MKTVLIGLLGYLLGGLSMGLVLAQNDLPSEPAAPQEVPQEQEKEQRPILPTQIRIPKLGIDASVEQVSRNAWGNMAVPKSYRTVAWYKDGALPGAEGSAVIAGHLDNSLGLPAVFIDLKKLEVGDVIYLANKAGEERTFTVTSRKVYDRDYAPLHELFRTDGESVLRLITCAGPWNPARKDYEERLVITAVPD